MQLPGGQGGRWGRGQQGGGALPTASCVLHKCTKKVLSCVYLVGGSLLANLLASARPSKPKIDFTSATAPRCKVPAPKSKFRSAPRDTLLSS
jgi:hypothetical protein